MISLARWPAVERLLLAALEYPEAERNAYLDDACPDDLRPLVRRLIGRLDADDVGEVLQLDPEWLREAAAAAGEEGPGGAGTSEEALPLTEIGMYRVLRLLGRGGMGEVYLVERDSPGFPALAALKVLRRDLGGAETALRFRRERIMLAAAAGPYVPRLLDAGTTQEGRPYYVMEYVDGTSLTTYGRGLSASARLDLFEEVCRAVAHVHDRLIVHRDLKPEHIFVTEHDGSARVKLLDFGIATITLPSEDSDDAATMRGDAPAAALSMLELTQKGAAPFTSRYAAPEQRAGGPVTTASDVYALGVVFCELLAGHAPGDGGEDCFSASPAPSEVVASYGARPSSCPFQDVCRRALQPLPGERYRSAARFGEAVCEDRIRRAASPSGPDEG